MFLIQFVNYCSFRYGTLACHDGSLVALFGVLQILRFSHLNLSLAF